MPAVRWTKIALVVSSVWYSSITGTNWSRNASHFCSQPGGRSAVAPPTREVAVGQPGAADLLEQVENLFPLAEGVQERAERAQVEPVGAHADQVAGDAVHLGDDHAQVPGLLGQLESSAASRPPAPSRDSCSSRPDSPSGRCRESTAAA